MMSGIQVASNANKTGSDRILARDRNIGEGQGVADGHVHDPRAVRRDRPEVGLICGGRCEVIRRLDGGD